MNVRRDPSLASGFVSPTPQTIRRRVASGERRTDIRCNLRGQSRWIAPLKETDAKRPAMTFIARRPGVGLHLRRSL